MLRRCRVATHRSSCRITEKKNLRTKRMRNNTNAARRPHCCRMIESERRPSTLFESAPKTPHHLRSKEKTNIFVEQYFGLSTSVTLQLHLPEDNLRQKLKPYLTPLGRNTTATQETRKPKSKAPKEVDVSLCSKIAAFIR